MVMGEEPTEAPERVFTTAGWLSLEREYVPRVVAGEHLHAHPEAKAGALLGVLALAIFDVTVRR